MITIDLAAAPPPCSVAVGCPNELGGKRNLVGLSQISTKVQGENAFSMVPYDPGITFRRDAGFREYRFRQTDLQSLHAPNRRDFEKTLRAAPLFAGLTDTQFGFLASRLVERNFDAGELIFQESQPCVGCYSVESSKTLPVGANKYSPSKVRARRLPSFIQQRSIRLRRRRWSRAACSFSASRFARPFARSTRKCQRSCRR